MKVETDTIPVEKKGQLEIEEKSATPRDLSRVIIKPSSGWVSLKLGELWEYRELLYFLV